MPSLTVEIQHIEPSKFFTDLAQTYVYIRDGEQTIKKLIAAPVGLIGTRAAVVGVQTQHRAISTGSDIGGYRKLSGLNVGMYATVLTTFSGTPIPTGEQPIEEYDRSGGTIEGVDSNGSTTVVAVRARKVVPGTQVCKVRMEVYHRTSGGTETLLDSWTTANLTSGFVDLSGTVTIRQSWVTGERIVLKAVGINLGIPP